MPILQAKNLTKSYGSFTAVNNVSFEIKQGEIFGLLGPNGAGKTTIIRILTGILKPNAGSVLIDDIDVHQHTTRAQQKMGIVPEMANAYIDLTAFENLRLMGQLYGLDSRTNLKRANKLLKLFKLEHRKKSKVKTFSKGMKQRVILAMALMNQSQILFLDEPTSGLDVESSRLIRSLIRELNQKRQTIILTTHDLHEANQLCDRVGIINQGKLLAIDRPETLKTKMETARSIEVAFEQEPKLNQLEFKEVSKVQKNGDKYRLFSDKTAQIIENILKYAQQHNNNIISLNTVSPSLEDVFIKLIDKKSNQS